VAIVDLFSRNVLSWKLSNSLDTEFCLDALKMALEDDRKPEVFHSDQGCQYRATAYRQLLEGHKISCSMSAKGCCWDNAVVESFFSTLKHELDLDDDTEVLWSSQQLQSRLAFWIDGYYNRERRHSRIGYLSPIDYEQQYIAARTLTTARP